MNGTTATLGTRRTAGSCLDNHYSPAGRTKQGSDDFNGSICKRSPKLHGRVQGV